MSVILGGPYEDVPLRRVLVKLARPPRATDGVVTAFRDGEVALRSSRREEGFTMSADNAGYQGVEPGDLVVHGLDAFAGSVGVSASRGKCTPVYHVCRTTSRADPRFVAWGLRALSHSGYLELQAGNVRQRAVDFRNWQTFASIRLPLPPPAAQRAIAAFLDAETRRIDDAMEALRRRELLLRELLHARVSASLSGEWGNIRLKFVVRPNVGSLSEDTDPDLTFRYVDISSVDSSGKVTLSSPMTFADAPSRARRLGRPGDVIISTVRTYLRAVAPVPESPTGLVFSTGFAVLSPSPQILPEYMRWAIQSDEFLAEVVARSVGINYPTINVGDLLDISIPLPPRWVQREIATQLEHLSDDLNDVVSRSSRQIDLLAERRRAVITAVVSGQMELPGVAA